MNRKRHLLNALALGSILVLTACSSPDPKLYTIAPVAAATPASGVNASSQPNVIVIQQIALARYLERPQIVRSSENYQLDVATNDWWGEPLPAMLSRVLVDELGQRLPGAVVLSEGGAVSTTANTTVELNILRLDLDTTGNLILSAQASVTAKDREKPAIQSFRMSVHPSAPGVQAQVAAISAAVGQLADKLAPMILAQSAGQ